MVFRVQVDIAGLGALIIYRIMLEAIRTNRFPASLVLECADMSALLKRRHVAALPNSTVSSGAELAAFPIINCISAAMKATRRRIALQKHVVQNSRRRLLCFAKAFGVRVRPRAAFLLRSAVFVTGLALASPLLAGPSKVAYFAGGCFWCTEAVFQQAPGVRSVVSGHMRNAETIQVTFDPTKTDYDKLLNLFWLSHDPTEVDRQGPDIGKQYRSAIFYADDQQRQAAEKSRAQLAASGKFSRPIATEISPAGNFRRADDHHQNFSRKNRNNPYVRQWIAPKLKKLGMKEP